jgi:hypothetical protein
LLRFDEIKPTDLYWSKTVTAMAKDNRQLLSFQAGEIVYTCYGAGVIVSTEGKLLPESNTDERWYNVRLWRRPNHSIASSAMAKLRSSVVCLTFIS